MHRLDKDTSGLMVVAKTDNAHRALSAPVRRTRPKGAGTRLSRLRLGRADQPKGTIDAPLDRHPQARDKRAVREGGREAVTHWRVLERYSPDAQDGKPVASLLACTLDTGRTHQIRVHLAHIGHPILGDATYATGFKTKASLLLARGARTRSTPSAARRCTPTGSPSRIPTPANVMEFRSELPADLRRPAPGARRACAADRGP